MLKYLIIFFLLLGCGKFNLSPYISDTKKIQHNQNTLQSIKSIESGTSNEFKVALISDTHDYYHELKKIVHYINNRRSEYAFAIVLGDITNIGILREYKTAKKMLDKLKIPYLMTIGNHDLLTNGEKIYRQMFGDQDYIFDFKQTRFIIYNNNNWESSTKVPDYNWVEKQLNSSTQTHNLLMAHVSVTDEARFSDTMIQNVKDLINTFNVKYLFNGHNHNPDESQIESATRVTVGSASKLVFCELKINNTSVTHDFIYP